MIVNRLINCLIKRRHSTNKLRFYTNSYQKQTDIDQSVNLQGKKSLDHDNKLYNLFNIIK
jgi:hypothetical protein